MDCSSFVLSIRTQKFMKDLQTFEDIFDFSSLNQNHELFSNKNKKCLGRFKNGTPKIFWIDEMSSLRSKANSIGSDDKSTDKLKRTSKSQAKNIKFEEIINCLFGGENQKE